VQTSRARMHSGDANVEGARVTCDAANFLGWRIGAVSAALMTALLLLRILLSPLLGPTRIPSVDPHKQWRSRLRSGICIIPLLSWPGGALWYRGRFVLCYSYGIAFAVTCVFSVVLLVGVVTAANQVGRRSIR
jgi:hypothetical protein